MSDSIHAVFDSADEALAAKAALLREGFGREAIMVMSNEPIHQNDDSDDTEGHIGLFAVIGGVVGAASAVLLTVVTAKRMGLVTGGMPVVTPWAFGIIVFELTMLGAILSTLGRMVYESGLARRGGLKHYDKSIAEGKVVVFARCSSDTLAEKAKRVLRRGESRGLIP